MTHEYPAHRWTENRVMAESPLRTGAEEDSVGADPETDAVPFLQQKAPEGIESGTECGWHHEVKRKFHSRPIDRDGSFLFSVPP